MTNPATLAGAVERAARAICEVHGQDPDDNAPLGMICGPNNEPLPMWRFYEEDAEAALSTRASLPVEGLASHSRHQWAQPGDELNRWWILRFADPDMREMVWSGPDAEAEARDAWNQYSPAWNCYLFATVSTASPPAGGDIRHLTAAERAHGEDAAMDMVGRRPAGEDGLVEALKAAEYVLERGYLVDGLAIIRQALNPGRGEGPRKTGIPLGEPLDPQQRVTGSYMPQLPSGWGEEGGWRPDREAVARIIETHIMSICSDGNADPRQISGPLADAILALPAAPSPKETGNG